jgi:hypothetical protein
VSVVQSAQQIASIAVIQNTYNGRPGVYGNLEAVARVGDQLQLYTGRNNQWDSGSPILIQGTPISGVTGVHGFTQDGDGGPFVVVAPLSSGGIGHYVRGNDEQWTWSQVGTFLQQYGTFDTISLIHSQKYGNLECIARINDKLAHFWYDGRTWNGGFISAS